MITMNNLNQPDQMYLQAIQDLDISDANRFRLLAMYFHNRGYNMMPGPAFRALESAVQGMTRDVAQVPLFTPDKRVETLEERLDATLQAVPGYTRDLGARKRMVAAILPLLAQHTKD